METSHETQGSGLLPKTRGWTILLTTAIAGAKVLLAGCTSSPGNLLGAGRFLTRPIPPGLAVPMGTSPRAEAGPRVPTQLGQAAVEAMAQRDLGDWRTSGKVTAPRAAVAKLAARRDIEAVNAYLCSVRPWSRPGSTWGRFTPTWAIHQGDYDFTEVALTALLYLFGDQPEVLYPETLAHMLQVLLLEEGGRPRPMVPRSLGLVLDTENHHLMREGSRYLKNQWLFEKGPEGLRGHPRYDNAGNGLEAWLIAYLDETIDEGVYEFNSIPYLKYTIEALLNLEAFPRSDEVTRRARHLLDTITWQYAVGSLDMRRCAPFRRRTEMAGDTRLDSDRTTAFMRVWLSPGYDPTALPPPSQEVIRAEAIAELMPYRPPSGVRAWTRHKAHDYFVKIGRGLQASPEIYSGGPGYLLSAGGVHRGPRSLIVARPNTLLLSDGALDLCECFHIRGRGSYRSWNNTGVYRHLMCGNTPVHIPARYAPEARGGGWMVFAPGAVPGLQIAVYNTEGFGVLVLFPDSTETPGHVLGTLREANPCQGAVRTQFGWPDGRRVAYDVNAGKGTWVIAAADGQPVERSYDAWPRVSGELPDSGAFAWASDGASGAP
jgi:hypothetical protein